MAIRSLRRPVTLAHYRSAPPAPAPSPLLPPPPSAPGRFGIRHQFPVRGEEAEGGVSDGYCFRAVFAAGRLERTYELVRSFLEEQGYGDVPLPADAAELRHFRLPPKLRHQLSLFGEDGYVHNPVKILFPPPGGRRGSLTVELYDEGAEGHLLRFHRRR